jgi:hypothetical protein
MTPEEPGLRVGVGSSFVALVDVRRLAAADMWGTAGTSRRRRLIRAEFFAGAFGCTALGLVVLVTGSGWMAVLGIWLVGAGTNYVPLAIEAQSLSKPGALEQELHGVDLRHELRSAGVRQLWIAVPFAVAISAFVRRPPRR